MWFTLWEHFTDQAWQSIDETFPVCLFTFLSPCFIQMCFSCLLKYYQCQVPFQFHVFFGRYLYNLLVSHSGSRFKVLYCQTDIATEQLCRWKSYVTGFSNNATRSLHLTHPSVRSSEQPLGRRSGSSVGTAGGTSVVTWSFRDSNR